MEEAKREPKAWIRPPARAAEPTIEWRESLDTVTIVDDSGLTLRIECPAQASPGVMF